MITAIAVVVALGVGFGVGRIKNVKKLAAIKAEIEAADSSAVSEVKTLVARVRSVLGDIKL
jgi:hypothetical protein